MRRDAQRRYPVEAQHRLSLWPRRSNDLARARLLIEPRVASEFLRVVNPSAVARVHLVVHPVADAYSHPVRQPDAARPTVARPLPRFVILQPRVDVVWVLYIHGQRVDLAQRQICQMVAGLAAVVGDKNAAVGSGDDPLGVLRIDPDGSEIAERPAEWPRLRPSRAGPGLAAVFGTAQIRAGYEEPVWIVLINSELIERVAGLTAHIAAVRAHFAPSHGGVGGCIRR